MKIAAIISEYNPFHNGHAKQFRLIRERLGGDTVIVCLMSGNFVQRGEPALLPKAVRAEAAVACGADLVLELPVTAALSSAEGFAAGGVRLLDALGVVDELCFGAETADRDALWQTAACLRTPAFSEALRRELAGGISFAAARSRALAQLGAAPEVVRQPNDILAVEYCKALQALGSQIEPAVFLRQGAYHAVLPEGENPSATSLRELARPEAWAAYVPAAALAVYARHPAQYRRENGERAMLAVLRRMPEAEFAALPYGSEGLWRKLYRESRRAGSVDALLDAVKSKRYARSRIARMCMCAYLGLDVDAMAMEPPYLRVLAMREPGRALLRQAHETSRIPLIQAGTRVRTPYFALETRACDLYAMFAPPGAPLTADGERHSRIFYQNEK